MKTSTNESLAIKVYPSQEDASLYVAQRIARIITEKQRKGETTVLGLATGFTPQNVYEELIRLHKDEGLSFKNVITFNLDEYYPIKATEERSFAAFMNKYLFDHIDIPSENINIPCGDLPSESIQSHCADYEKKIENCGGLDFQLLGIGLTGHIGFNEPGSSQDSITRLIALDDLTRTDASIYFDGKENVPIQAITMGVKTILQAKEIILIAWGERKAEIMQKALEGKISSEIPASFLRLKENVEYVLNKEAASLLNSF